ncbi:MAG: hypothetical protein J6W29_01560 [Neisseriaceae bacterium]|nr:hypothetical protein [Neisseriaceae bacterium]
MANSRTCYFTPENHNRQIAGKKVEKTRLISPLGEIFIDEVGKFSGCLKNKNAWATSCPLYACYDNIIQDLSSHLFS